MSTLASVVLRDILANRPAAGITGRLFYDTTNSQLQRDNGSSWDSIADAGGATDHGALTGLADDDHPQYATNTEFDDHNARHETGGADAIKLDDLATPDDNTDLNASTTRHGLLRKLSNVGTEYLDGTGAWSTPAGGPGGGAGLHLLDDITLHGTYGDHFDAPTLDADWTTVGTVARSIYVDGATHVRNLPIQTRSDWGITRAWTPTTEAEFRMAGSAFFKDDQLGLGLWLLDSSNNGIWLGSRETSRMGIWAVAAGVIADEPSDNNSAPGKIYLSEGRKVWWSLIKKGARYHWRFSLDGEAWTQSHKIAYVPSAFTPAKFGWGVGVVNTVPDHVINVDWINVQDDFSLGNNLMITPTSGTVTPTAATTTGGAVGDVIDGVDSDEWYVVGSANPIWWMATFSVDQTMNRIRLKVRGDAWGLGYLEFEDGSEVPFFAPANGWTHVDFPTKTTGFVKIHCLRQDHGANPGFQEVEAYLAS